MRKFSAIRDWTPGYINVAPEHVDIMVECTACSHTTEFDRYGLPNDLKHALISDVESRLKCSSCGAKSAKLRFGHWMV